MTRGFVLLCLVACSVSCHRPDNTSAHKLETVFTDNVYQFTGVAKQDNEKLLVNYPRWSDIYKFAVTQVTGKTTSTPYPDALTNEWNEKQSGADKWVCVQSVYADDDNNLWVLDPAAPFLKTIQDDGPKLVEMDGMAMAKKYFFKDILPDTAYVNDVRIDTKRHFAYLTESKRGGIIVVDLATGKMRVVLSTHYSVKSDPAFRFIVDGMELMKDGKPAKFNSDGIALTPGGEWLYYKPTTDDKLYRIETAALRNWNLGDAALGAKVQDLGHFVTTDGMIFDKQGNLYMGDIQHYRIIKIDPLLHLTVIAEDQRLIWPDSYSISQGWLYISCSQIQKQPEYNNGVNKRTSPYTVYRLKL